MRGVQLDLHNCKFFIKQILFLELALFFIIPISAYAEDPCSHVTVKWITTHLSISSKAKIVSKKNAGGLCETILMLNGDPVSFYCGKDFVIAGQMIKNNKFVTEETLSSLSEVFMAERKAIKERKEKAKIKRQKFFRDNFSKLSDMVLFKIGPEKALKSVFIVTDPGCSHCRHLISDFNKIAFEKNISAKVIIYPLLGEDSENMTYKAFCENYGYAEYKNIKPVENPVFCEKAKTLIDSEKKFFKKAGLNFIPVVIGEKGDWVVEGSDMALVKEKLGIE